MKDKKAPFLFLSFSIVGFLLGFALKSSIELGLCTVSEPSCINQLTQIGNALFYSMMSISVIFLILAFVPRAWEGWKKFAIWYLPLMFLYFLIYENSGFFSIPEEAVYRFLSIVYGVISVVIIGWVAFTKKK